MTPEDKEKIIEHLLASKEIQTMYDNYIIKEIEFEYWVRATVDRLINYKNPIDITKVMRAVYNR